MIAAAPAPPANSPSVANWSVPENTSTDIPSASATSM